jgi:hypothetical protein
MEGSQKEEKTPSCGQILSRRQQGKNIVVIKRLSIIQKMQ